MPRDETRAMRNSVAARVACLLAGLLLVSGCRCAGFYDPVYNQNQVEQLLKQHFAELNEFAAQWLRDHRDDGIDYQDCHGEKFTVVRYSRDDFRTPPAVISLDSNEAAGLQNFARRLKLAHVYVFPTSPEHSSWYLSISFQGGAKWPYGLLYIPVGEPLNMLNSANGVPGPGFSKLVLVQGRWFYFESS
jgi:hypothetical protein